MFRPHKAAIIYPYALENEGHNDWTWKGEHFEH